MPFHPELGALERRTGLTASQLVAAARARGFDDPSVEARRIAAWLKDNYDLERRHAAALVRVLRDGRA